jgi:hypothetical protein
MSMPTELVIAIIVVQLGALVVQQQRLIGILRSHCRADAIEPLPREARRAVAACAAE